MSVYTSVYTSVYASGTSLSFLSYDGTLSRVRVSLDAIRTDLGSDDTALVERSLDQVTWTTVRGGTSVPVRSGVVPLDDYEFSPEVLNYYRVTALTAGTVYADQIEPSLAGQVWLKNLRFPFLNIAVSPSDASDITFPAAGTTFAVMGRTFPVAVTQQRSSAQFSLTVATTTAAERDAVRAIVASGDVLFVQLPPGSGYQLDGGYYAVGDVTETRNGVVWDRRWLTLPLTAVAAPDSAISSAVTIYQTIKSTFASYRALTDTSDSYADVQALTSAPADVYVTYMRPVSGALLSAITGSHAMAVQVLALSGYQEGISPTGGTEIVVQDGDVSLDSTADVRGTADVTTSGAGWSPRPGAHILQPYGTELFIRRGVVVGGSAEWVSQGYYKIQSAQRDRNAGTLRISASDRMQSIIDAQLPTPVTFKAGATVEDIFGQLIGDVYPSATIDFDYGAGADTLGTAQTTSQDRYGFLHSLANSRGKIMYWDYRGRLQVKDLPSASSPVWAAKTGEGGVIVTMTDQLDRDGIFNAVVASGDGSGSDSPPVALVYNSDPDSPTYYWGPFGQVPFFYSSSLIEGTAQAAAAAELVLSRTIGLTYEADFTLVPNPALEPLDPITLADQGTHVIQQITIPLTAADAMTATTREQGGLSTEAVDITTGDGS